MPISNPSAAFLILRYLYEHGDEEIKSAIRLILDREAIRRNLHLTAAIRERRRAGSHY